jgi:hypothetical protein
MTEFCQFFEGVYIWETLPDSGAPGGEGWW